MRHRARVMFTETEAFAVLGAITGTIEDYTASGEDAPPALITAKDAIKRGLDQARAREAREKAREARS